MKKIKINLGAVGHPIWPMIQYFNAKIFLLVKFFICARLLGPESIGILGIGLLVVSILESITETGVVPAMIQRGNSLLDEEFCAVMTLQILRGGAMFSLMVIGVLIYNYFHSITKEVMDVVLFSAFIPLFRGCYCLGYIDVIRGGNFKKISLLDSIYGSIDFFLTVALIYFYPSPISFIASLIFVELLRGVVSWTLFRRSYRPLFNFKIIDDIRRYGRWIWATSVFSAVLNQFDKIFVGNFLGAKSFGFYQTGSRISQMAISDIAVAYCQYLFPSFVAKLKNSNSLIGDFRIVLLKIGVLCGILVLLTWILIEHVVRIILGVEWIALVEIVKIQIVGMWFGALISVCVAYLKAVAAPRVITIATIVQLMATISLVTLLIEKHGMLGVAFSVDAALALSFLVMYIFIERKMA